MSGLGSQVSSITHVFTRSFARSAAAKGWANVVEFLVSKAPELLQVRNLDGQSPLDIAKAHKRGQVAAILEAASGPAQGKAEL